MMAGAAAPGRQDRTATPEPQLRPATPERQHRLAVLERQYRRLLTCYPQAHRRTYGEEMIGVLLASAQPGQQRPGLRDTLDMFNGGASVRVRAWLTGGSDPGWGRALALTTLIAPVLLAVMSRVSDNWILALGWPWPLTHSPGPLGGLAGDAIWLVPVLLALAGLRRIATVASLATLVWVLVVAEVAPTFLAGRLIGLLEFPAISAFLVLLVVQSFALAVSPGPRFALRLITPAGVVMTIPWLLTAAYTARTIPTHYPVPLVVAEAGIGLVALAALASLATPGGRRLILLNAVIPLSALATTIMTFARINYVDLPLVVAVITVYAPPVLLAALTYLLIKRSNGDSTAPEVGVAA
jgi:hypothetical protein